MKRRVTVRLRNRVSAVRLDNLGDPVADELVVGDSHAWTVCLDDDRAGGTSPGVQGSGWRRQRSGHLA